jgi:hypothetical protein
MARGRFNRAGFLGAALALASLAVPAQAQFGGILGGAIRGATSSPQGGCKTGKSRSLGSRIAGGALGGAASNVAGSVSPVFGWVPIAGLTDQLTAEIACKLDPEEQKQAAQATLEATRGTGDKADVAVGTSSEWTSGTREEVSGRSTVVARNDNSGGGMQCITVSDVIIVMGEETRADKRMCRRPPAARYTLNA